MIIKKKGLKCGLLLALFIIFGLSLIINLNDSSALKYSFDTFPLYQARYSDTSAPTGEIFGFWYDTSQSSNLSFSDNLFSLDYTYKYGRYLDNNICINRSNKTDIFDSYNISSRNYTNIWSGEGTSFYRTFDSNECQYNLINYSYDSFFGNTYNISNGDVEKVVDIDRALFSFPSNETRYLKRVTIPLNFDSQVTFPANTPMSFSFGLVTGSANGFSDYISPHVNFDVYYSSDGVSYHDTVSSCIVDDNYGFLTVNPDLSVSGAFSGFLVTCTYTPSVSVSHFSSRLIVYGGTIDYNPSSFLSYSSNNGLYFSASYLVTNNDDTWSGQSISPAPTGDDISNAPGYTQLYGVDTPVCIPGDFLCELNNLFGFTFINPFEPIFRLFTDNGSCAQIPTIAGMIHSEETQVCPWFDSTTRNIVTPVLGLSSMMLVFGFAVRWLGSSSGNMFEDSGSIESPGFSATGGTAIHHGWRRKK